MSINFFRYVSLFSPQYVSYFSILESTIESTIHFLGYHGIVLFEFQLYMKWEIENSILFKWLKLIFHWFAAVCEIKKNWKFEPDMCRRKFFSSFVFFFSGKSPNRNSPYFSVVFLKYLRYLLDRHFTGDEIA